MKFSGVLKAINPMPFPRTAKRPYKDLSQKSILRVSDLIEIARQWQETGKLDKNFNIVSDPTKRIPLFK